MAAAPKPSALPGEVAAAVRVEGLTKSFPVRRTWRQVLTAPFARAERVTVVRDVSFEVGTAEFFGLLGANGAGKTTLFKMLATQLLPDSGGATVAGKDVLAEPEQVRRVLTPVVADERSLNWRLTARENLELFAALYGLGGRGRDLRIQELLETVELTDTGTKMVGAFSSGMKQRLLIARALLGSPRVLLLDEPTRSLDPLSARRFRAFLKDELAARQRCTVLLATHSADEAFELCDRVAILDKGRVAAVGAVDRLMARVSDDRYRLQVRADHLPALLRMSSARGLTEAHVLEALEADGWETVELNIPDGTDGAAEALAAFTGAGLAVSSFERRGLSLADLLERITQGRPGAPRA